MFQAMCRVNAIVVFFVAFFILSQDRSVHAQLAPTNTATISGSVSDSSGKPAVNATVSLSGPRSATAQTDPRGLFVFVGMPYGTYHLSAAAAGLGTATRSITVEGDTNVAIQYETGSQNGLKVIANVTSAANAHFNITAASISQVSPQENAFAGTATWRTILTRIPGISMTNAPDAVGSHIPDNPLQPVIISINGSLPYETATLLDDMPLLAGSGFNVGNGTDLSFLPLNGVSAADVIRGPGANAPSIVDSIGGSFVLHSPGAVNQNHYEFSVSNGLYGGILANGLAAVRWKKLSAVVAYGVNHQDGPLKDAAAVTSQIGELVNPLTVNGQSFRPFIPPGCTFPGCEQFGPVELLFNPNFNSPFNTPGVNYGRQGGVLYCCTDQRSTWNQHSGSIGLTYQPSSSLTLQLFWAGQNSIEPSNALSQQYNFLPPAGYTGSISPGTFFLQTNAGGLLGSSPFLQGSSVLEEKITAQLGRGQLRLAALQSRSFDLLNCNAPGTPQTIQIWGAGFLNGSPTPTFFNGDHVAATFFPFHLFETNATNSREMLLSYTTPLGENLHAGASFVRGFANGPFGFTEVFGAFPLTGGTDAANSQTTNELRVFVGGNPSAKTSLDLSGYFTNAQYHTLAGSTWTDTRVNYTAPRLGFVWRPTTSVAIRAAAGGGFAEPPLGDYIGSPSTANFGTFFLTCAPNPNLQPEKSFGFDLGTDLQLHGGNVLSVDLYRTNLYGQLYQGTNLVTNNFNGTGVPLFSKQFGNLGVSRMEGILVDLRHDVPRGMYWSVSGGLTRGFIVSLPSNFYDVGLPCDRATLVNCTNLGIMPGPNFAGNFSIAIPYAQALGTIGYRWNVQKYVDLVGTYYGNNNAYNQPAFVELDGHAGYPLTKSISLVANFLNITGIHDGSNIVRNFDGFSGVPTIAGPPIGLDKAPYGIRTITMTMQIHL